MNKCLTRKEKHINPLILLWLETPSRTMISSQLATNWQISTRSWQKSTDNSQLTTDWYQLATDNWQISTRNWLISTDRYQLATDKYQLTTRNSQLATRNWQLTDINSQLKYQLTTCNWRLAARHWQVSISRIWTWILFCLLQMVKHFSSRVYFKIILLFFLLVFVLNRAILKTKVSARGLKGSSPGSCFKNCQYKYFWNDLLWQTVNTSSFIANLSSYKIQNMPIETYFILILKTRIARLEGSKLEGSSIKLLPVRGLSFPAA